MNVTKTVSIFFAIGATVMFSACSVIEPEERPIRPTSENSDLAHGSSTPTGNNALGGALAR